MKSILQNNIRNKLSTVISYWPSVVEAVRNSELKFLLNRAYNRLRTIIFSELQTEIRVDKAEFDGTVGILNVYGWCLSPETSFDLLLWVHPTNILKEIEPNTIERLDVFSMFPQNGNKHSGWKVSIPLGSVQEDAIVQVSYVSDRTNQVVESPITLKKVNDTELVIRECLYSPLRSLCTIKGHIIGRREVEQLCIENETGHIVGNFASYLEEPAGTKKKQQFKLQFLTGGISDKECLTVFEKGNKKLACTCKIKTIADSKRRQTALKSSVYQTEKQLESALEIDSLIKLKHLLASCPNAEKDQNEICYFPPFQDLDNLSDHYHRASWYLSGNSTVIEAVNMKCSVNHLEISQPPKIFASQRFDDSCINLITSDKKYLKALQRAKVVLVWKQVDKTAVKYLGKLLGGAVVITVANDDPAAVEYGNYCRVQWLMASEKEKKELLQKSQERFCEVFTNLRLKGKTCSAVFGTGPSIDTAYNFDFSNCMSIACNSIVANEELMDHISPSFVCAGDAVSHFGVSSYAEKYRVDLIRALTTRDIYFFTSALFGYLLIQKHPEIRERVILCDQKFNGLNAELEKKWALPRFDSTLNIHMLPVAASYSDTIFMLGLDGKSPDPAENEDFWAHSKAAQYHDLVDTGHLAHPTFAINRAQATADRYLASVQESFLAGECLGKLFYSLADSYTPAVHARPAPQHILVNKSLKNSCKLIPVQKNNKDLAEKRALVIFHIPRHHFSGGRYHATWLAETMTFFCDEVVIWSDNIPPWKSDLCFSDTHSKVNFWINDFITPPEGEFNYIIVVPDGSKSNVKYQWAYKLAKKYGAKTAFINFESPNWFNAISPSKKNLKDYGFWFASACFSDLVLSLAEEATPFAEGFYKTLYHKPQFKAIHPSINSPIADNVLGRGISKENQIIVISRFSDAHKNVYSLLDILPDEAKGYTIALIAGTSILPGENIIAEMHERLADKGFKLKLLHMISDRKKFEEIARSELMLFPSLFEGYGYPPIEAGYIGTPCITYDLPVLKEFNSDYAYFVPLGDADAMREKAGEVLRMAPEERMIGDSNVTAFATCRSSAKRLERFFNECTGEDAASHYTPEKFDFAVKMYLQGCVQSQIGSVNLTFAELIELEERYFEYLHAIEELRDRMRARLPKKTKKKGLRSVCN